MKNSDKIRLNVSGIALDEKSELPIVILKDESTSRVLPIPIGPFEASAIIIEIEGVHPPRPLTHDLLAGFIEKHHFKMLDLYIYNVIDEKHFANIEYKKGFRKYSLNVRPSDGIALAIRLNAPIYSNLNVMQKAFSKSAILTDINSYSNEILYLDNEEYGSSLM